MYVPACIYLLPMGTGAMPEFRSLDTSACGRRGLCHVLLCVGADFFSRGTVPLILTNTSLGFSWFHFWQPYQTLDGWEHSLRSAVEANPHHVSIYDLQVEPGTKFGRLYRPGDAPLPSDDISAEMYSMGSAILTAAGCATDTTVPR